MPCRFFNFLSFFWNVFLETIFPWHCCFCKKETQHYPLCQNCQENIIINHFFICPHCNKTIIDLSENCCSSKESLDVLGYASSYQNPILKQVIHVFKYQRIVSLQKPLSNLMIKYLEKTKSLPILKQKDILLISIPLHFKKQKQRSFNQSELLTKNIASYFKFPTDFNILIRIKNNPSQAKTQGFIKKKQNVKNIFEISKKQTHLIKDKWIILIDDVYTSGATMQEAAKVLKQNGAKKVIGLVLAKGVI